MSDNDKDWLKGTPLRDLIKRVEELENHDIFKIWTSIRKGGKTTLDALIKNAQGIRELEKKLNKVILHWSNYGDMADLIRNDNANRISKLENKLKNK